MKTVIFTFLMTLIISCKELRNEKRTLNFPKQEVKVTNIPHKTNIWVFIMSGQSNMAGRGFVEPQDTIASDRILTVNKNNELIFAKEPIHFYEPSVKGLDLGMAFSKAILEKVPDSVSVLILPAAVGGSSIEQWINNSEHRSVKLFTNFKDKVKIGKSYGILKGILWHQGESNALADSLIVNYDNQLSKLFAKFRRVSGNENLPILVGQLGSFSKNTEQWKKINLKILAYADATNHVKVVYTSDLNDKGDMLHFDTKSIRVLGRRYAQEFFKIE